MVQKVLDFSAAALAYVRHVLHEKKMSPTGLAKRAGISSTTLTRALNDRKHRFSLSVKTLEKIYEASGINPAGFLIEIGSDELNTAQDLLRTTLAQPESLFSSPSLLSRDSREADVTAVVGTVAAGRWREPTILDAIRLGSVPIRHSLYRPSECFVCMVGDDSINRTARKNELLYCVRLDAVKHSLPDQAVVIVERRSENGFKIELTARQIKRYKKGWILSFATTNRDLKEVVDISDLFAPRLRIIGLVECVFRLLLPDAVKSSAQL
jgi:transcriptional regulator with XRE-family HTH domain